MKQELMEILACPKCKGDLELKVEEEIIKGMLSCKSCGIDYPITDAIPNLLIPE